MNPNSKNITKMLTAGYSVNKEVTAGMLKTPLKIIYLGNKAIWIIDVMGSIVKYAFEKKSGGAGHVKTTKLFHKYGKKFVNIKGRQFEV